LKFAEPKSHKKAEKRAAGTGTSPIPKNPMQEPTVPNPQQGGNSSWDERRDGSAPSGKLHAPDPVGTKQKSTGGEGTIFELKVQFGRCDHPKTSQGVVSRRRLVDPVLVEQATRKSNKNIPCHKIWRRNNFVP